MASANLTLPDGPARPSFPPWWSQRGSKDSENAVNHEEASRAAREAMAKPELGPQVSGGATLTGSIACVRVWSTGNSQPGESFRNASCPRARRLVRTIGASAFTRSPSWGDVLASWAITDDSVGLGVRLTVGRVETSE